MTDTEHASIVDAVLALGDTLATRHPSVEQIAEQRRQQIRKRAINILAYHVCETDPEGWYTDFAPAISILNHLEAAGLAIMQKQPE